MRIDGNGLEVLTRAESMRLLESTSIGRPIGALPVVLPVNYAVVDGDIVIRTTAGPKLDAAAMNSVVAFEIDGFDPTITAVGVSSSKVSPRKSPTPPNWTAPGGPPSSRGPASKAAS